MFKILGAKVLLTMLVLAVLAGGLGYGLYQHLIPMRQQKEQELASLKAAIEQRRREVARLKEEFVLLKEQLRAFKELEAQGFFNNQNRADAKESFEKLGDLAGLIKARFRISKGEQVEDPLASDAGHVVLKSPVELEIDALDDVDVYTFVKAVQERFQGNVDVTNVSIMRKMNVSAPLLRQIGSGTPVKMVEAKLKFDWRTMAPKDRLDEFDTETSEGAQGEDAALPATDVKSPVIVDPAAPVPASSMPTSPAVPATAATPVAPAAPAPVAGGN